MDENCSNTIIDRTKPSLYCHHKSCYTCCCGCNDNDDDHSFVDNNFKGLSEPLLLPTTVMSKCDDHHRTFTTTTTTVMTTTTTTTIVTTVRFLFFIIIGYIIGTESAKMGLYGLLGNDETDAARIPWLLYSYHYYSTYYHSYNENNINFNDDDSATLSSSPLIISTTTRLQSLPYSNTVLVSFALALLWSISTILVTFLSYQILQPIIIRLHSMFLSHPSQPEKHEIYIDFIQPITGIHHDDFIILDEEYNQLMITMGTCIGFTVTCFFTG